VHPDRVAQLTLRLLSRPKQNSKDGSEPPPWALGGLSSPVMEATQVGFRAEGVRTWGAPSSHSHRTEHGQGQAVLPRDAADRPGPLGRSKWTQGELIISLFTQTYPRWMASLGIL
jgi:hypothetical protein